MKNDNFKPGSRESIVDKINLTEALNILDAEIHKLPDDSYEIQNIHKERYKIIGQLAFYRTKDQDSNNTLTA